MNWNPMMGPLGASTAPQSPDLGSLAQAFAQQYKPNQLGSGVTLGNPQAQQDYAQQLAQALADGDFSAKQIDRAAGMMSPEFIQNSGIAGVADMILKTYAGKKMDEKARKLQADAEGRRMTAQEGYDDRRAAKESERAEGASTRERTRRSSLAQQMGLNRREALEFIETGKVPQAVRGVPMMTDQGLVNVDPYTGEYRAVSQHGQGQQREQQLPPNVRLDPNLSPQERAAALADIQAGMPEGDAEYRIQQPQQQQRPLMPYQDPVQAQRQAAADARAERADQRAERALQFQQDQAAGNPTNAKAENAASLRGAQIGNVERGISRIEQALNSLEGNTFADTGVVDQWITGQTDQGRELKAAVGAIQNSMLGLTRVPGIGAQSDLEARIAALQYPSLDMPMETNRKTVENLRALIRDLSGQQAPQGGNDDDLVNKYLRP